MYDTNFKLYTLNVHHATMSVVLNNEILLETWLEYMKNVTYT